MQKRISFNAVATSLQSFAMLCKDADGTMHDLGRLAAFGEATAHEFARKRAKQQKIKNIKKYYVRNTTR